MRKPLLTVTLFLIALVQLHAQDKMKKHSGETLDVKILRVNDLTINYKYPGEDAEQTIGKLAVAEITYSSGRKETISDKIVVNGKDDWEKVQILTDKAQVLGLKKGGEVRGKTSGLLSYNTAGSADKKATKRIKQDAAELNAPFILLTSDKNDGYGIKQAIKDGVVYSYK